MPERNTTDQSSIQEETKDRVGDIIRKERVTRRITVETIAKDLKLNSKYIKSLEANEYDALPADPYVRVYLRSLAKYLSLDPDSILKKFYEERGLSPELYKKESAEKLEVSMTPKDEHHNPVLIIAVILIIILGAFSFIANQQGWITSPIVTSSSKTATTTIDSSANQNDSLFDDSLYAGAPVQVADSTEIPDSVKVFHDPAYALQLRLDVISDSVWIRVFCDGQSWKNILHKNQSRSFSAKDSFNIHVGSNALVKYTVNGKEVKIKGIGVVAFKYDTSHVPKMWTLTRWNSVFKDRL